MIVAKEVLIRYGNGEIWLTGWGTLILGLFVGILAARSTK